MTIEEVSGMLDVMNMAYPHFTRNMTDAERKAQLRIWSAMLARDNPAVVGKVLRKHIALNKFPPTIAEIRSGIREETMPSPNALLEELKVQSYKATQSRSVLVKRGENGMADTYRNESFRDEAFEELSDVLKKYIGSPKNLDRWYRDFRADEYNTTKRFMNDITELQEQADIAPLLGDGNYGK